jgi:predicted lipoprotein
MIGSRSAAAVLATLCALAACKIEDTTTPTAEDGGSSAPATDADRMAALVEESWQAQVLPAVEEHAVDVATLRQILADGLGAAGDAHGLRPDGEANSWNFVISGTGTAIEADFESRAATMSLDTDGDGAGDVELMLGPVIRGTAIRDAMPFYAFSDFRDQIEFAKLGRALNDRAAQDIARPEDDPIGKSYTFTAVMTLKAADDDWTAVPITLEPAP